MSAVWCGPVFLPDPDLPADPYSGRRVCAYCRLPGEQGDAHHTPRDVPGQQESRRRAGDTEPEGVGG